jgi:hypothetical protein
MILLLALLLIAAAAQAGGPEPRFRPDETYPVYSGPGEEYLRGANGKAAVSTNGEVSCSDIEGDWAQIHYQVSEGAYRTGYIAAEALLNPGDFRAPQHILADGMAAADCALTDDANYSRRTLRDIPQGTPLTLLQASTANFPWVYVEVRDGLTAPARGYIPAAAYAPRSADATFARIINCLPLRQGGYFVHALTPDLKDWFAYTTPMGQVISAQWGDAQSMYRYVVQGWDAVYACQAIRGLAPADQPTRLLPLLRSGEVGEAILLPSWMGGAAHLPLDEGVLFYGVDGSDPARFFRLAMVDLDMNLLWESALPQDAMPAVRLIDCLPAGDGYILLGCGQYGVGVALMGVDGAGQKLWAHAYAIDALPGHIELMGDALLLRAMRMTAQGEAGAQWLFCLNTGGEILWQRLLTEEAETVQFQEMHPIMGGYLLEGEKSIGGDTAWIRMWLSEQGEYISDEITPGWPILPWDATYKQHRPIGYAVQEGRLVALPPPEQ